MLVGAGDGRERKAEDSSHTQAVRKNINNQHAIPWGLSLARLLTSNEFGSPAHGV